MTKVIERFAPTPSGALHLGHAFSAFTAWDAAHRSGGHFLLRMDDLDRTRCKPQFVEGIIADMRWLELPWHGDILHQSQRASVHEQMIRALQARELVYACTCSRQEIQAAAGAPQEGAEGGPAYPGTCRGRDPAGVSAPHALRLDIGKAIDLLGGPAAISSLTFTEIGAGPSGESGEIALDADQLITGTGDIVLRRKDEAMAYHLAVVVDDAFQHVSHVTRARDLFASTPVHRLLQALIGLPTPIYRHHRIVRDDTGRRLAKRDGDMALASLRDAGATATDIRRMLGLDSSDVAL